MQRIAAAVVVEREQPVEVSTEATPNGDRATVPLPASAVVRAAAVRADEPLHALLDRRRSDVIERFVRAFRDERLAEQDEPRTVLVDDLVFFMADLVDALRRGEVSVAETARSHGFRRRRLGFDLRVVLREFAVLRRSILGVVTEQGAAPELEELAILDRCIDDAMAEAAAAYTAQRYAEVAAERDAVAAERERLRLAVQSRDDVLAIVSHDLRNPVTAIALGIDQLRRSGDDQERRARLFDSIARSARRMSRLIEDLLAIARIEGGQLTIEREPHPVQAILDDALSTARPAADEKGIRMIADVPSSADGLTLSCDRERVLQVLENLIGNATKFAPRGGTIAVRVRRQDAEARIEVQDDGPGISRDALPYVFDRFYQAPGVRRGGAGLGLAIARGIVEAHGGRVGVDSALGAGTTIWFTVPLQGA
ncbi:MAG: HAMP domain-containing histidine kinase [Deltaproteobacteria bacterium]|nr:HAMP domain-containing histidine kinase [Deltaproteobacteria bacterium]